MAESGFVGLALMQKANVFSTEVRISLQWHADVRLGVMAESGFVGLALMQKANVFFH